MRSSEGGVLLRTKLYRPPVASGYVVRQRLIEQMSRGLEVPLTLISAPAGYGKTSLVSQWVESTGISCAWLSLDKKDSSLRVFLEYLLTSIEMAAPDSCPESRDLIDASQLPAESVLAPQLINELDAIEFDLAIVLDDYQRLDPSSPVHGILSALLEHPPRRVRLILASRHDPPLRLAGPRASAQIVELRLHDLRFTQQEIVDLFSTTTRMSLSDRALVQIQEGIEGWPAGLHLLLLALQSNPNPEAVLTHLQGGLPQMQDYLLDEVLEGLPEELRDWLRKSSILNRFCAPLLGAILEPQPRLSGRAILSMLRESNLFVIPLDIQGTWYRYHQVFQELLQNRLRDHLDSAEVATLHAQASGWLESQGHIGEAIAHSLEALDVDRASAIVERHRMAELTADRWYVVEKWLQMIPAEVVRARPGLLLTDSWVAYCRLEMDRIADNIARIKSIIGEQLLEREESAELDFFRGSLNYWMGDPEESRQQLESALIVLRRSAPYVEAEAELALALSRCMTGDGDVAARELQKALHSRSEQESSFEVRIVGAMVFVELLGGDLPRALSASKRMYRAASEGRLRNTEAWAYYLRGCAHLHACELDSAARFLSMASDRRHVFETEFAADAIAGLALTQQLRSRPQEADETVRRLFEFAAQQGAPQLDDKARSIAARIALLRGEPAPTAGWESSKPDELTVPELFLWIEVPAITAARLQIAKGSSPELDRALESLGVIRRKTEARRFTNQTIEVAVLQALALAVRGDAKGATKAAAEAVALAWPGGWVRPFVEAGPPMLEALRPLAESDEATEFIRRVVATLEERDSYGSPGKAPESKTPMSARDRRTLDSLTNRELDVLELLAQRLTNQEIATRLGISSHTVNDHLKHIYQKLQVQDRRQAAERAFAMGILDRDQLWGRAALPVDS